MTEEDAHLLVVDLLKDHDNGDKRFSYAGNRKLRVVFVANLMLNGMFLRKKTFSKLSPFASHVIILASCLPNYRVASASGAISSLV